MSGDHQHCAKHPDRLAVAGMGEFNYPVCKECYDEITDIRRINYAAGVGSKQAGIGWGGD